MWSFGRDLRRGNITPEDAVQEQIILKMQLIVFVILLDQERKKTQENRKIFPAI